MSSEDTGVKGSSKSLNKTISELVEYMNDRGIDVDSPLRQQMYLRIAEISRWWAEEGFKIGVNTVLNEMNVKKLPLDGMEYDLDDAYLAPGVQQPLQLRWPRRIHRRGRKS